MSRRQLNGVSGDEKSVLSIWLFTLLLVAIGVNWVTAPSFATQWFTDRRAFQALVTIPGILIIGLPVFLRLLRPEIERASSSDSYFVWLVCYCNFVVLVTGGLANSPFNGLIPIVPLLGSSLIGERKKNLLVCYFTSVSLLLFLWFTPAAGYLNAVHLDDAKKIVWGVPDVSHHCIVAALTCLAIFGEIVILRNDEGFRQELN